MFFYILYIIFGIAMVGIGSLVILIPLVTIVSSILTNKGLIPSSVLDYVDTEDLCLGVFLIIPFICGFFCLIMMILKALM